MNGDEIRRARERLKWTQERLAAEMEVGLRTVGNWERGSTVPKNRRGRLEQILGPALLDDGADPIRSYSDVSLLGELLRRAAERERNGG